MQSTNIQESQHQAVKSHLLSGLSITQDQALNNPKFNKCWRLSVIINRLRNEGLNINTELVQNGNGSKHARYYLVMDAVKSKELG